MTQKKFEKVVEYKNIDNFRSHWDKFLYVFGLLSLPSVLLVITKFILVDVHVPENFLEGYLLVMFTLTVIIVLVEYISNRKIYWKEVETDE